MGDGEAHPPDALRHVVVERMGREGDAQCDTPEGRLHVPFALPGEAIAVAAVADRGDLVAIERASPDRIAPICRHFGVCGGCKLQHWGAEPYLAWKRGLVVSALAAHGFPPGDLDAIVAPAVDAHGAGRRRVTFHARRENGVTRAGFMRAGSHALVAIDACPILSPALAAAPPIAAEIARALRGAKPLDIVFAETEAGLDVTLRGHGPPTPGEREAALALAERHDVARLANHHEAIVERRRVFVSVAGCRVTLPPGGFLQATARGEEVLAGLVAEALAGRRRIADLFCGVGPFALRAARRAQIRAYDMDAAATAALSRAVRETQGLKPVAAEARDLFRRPLLAAELKDCDAVILDPPRQGAQAQARELARSGVRRIAYVSCNPVTFARDAALIAAGDHRLLAVTPVDQFRYSAHVELVGVFERCR
jgi:23S rRNA (uracil1939-C5)-methyltransferase